MKAANVDCSEEDRNGKASILYSNQQCPPPGLPSHVIFSLLRRAVEARCRRQRQCYRAATTAGAAMKDVPPRAKAERRPVETAHTLRCREEKRQKKAAERQRSPSFFPRRRRPPARPAQCRENNVY